MLMLYWVTIVPNDWRIERVMRPIKSERHESHRASQMRCCIGKRTNKTLPQVKQTEHCGAGV